MGSGWPRAHMITSGGGGEGGGGSVCVFVHVCAVSLHSLCLLHYHSHFLAPFHPPHFTSLFFTQLQLHTMSLTSLPSPHL